MTLLAIACLAFILTHLGVSSTPLRDLLKNTIGEGPYLGLYSLVAAGTLGLMIYAYATASHTDFLWSPSKGAYVIAKVLMPVALVFLVGGLMNGNPTSVAQAEAVKQDLAWIFKITRHPVQWGILLWAIGHLVANGDTASLLLFGTLAAVSGLGMLAMDAKFRKREGAEWARFFETTSYVPFVALITGKNSMKFNEISWLNVGIGLVVYVLVYAFHGWIAGVPLM